MKKLLVFLLCAALMIPTVGMNAQAAEPKSKEVTGDQLAESEVMNLNIEFSRKNFQTKEGLDEAKAIMKQAADTLKLGYTESTGKLYSTPNDKLDASVTEETVREHIRIIVEELGKCKEKENKVLEEQATADSIKEKVEEAVASINKCYANQKFTAEEKVAADTVMDEAAQVFDCTYNKDNGTLTVKDSIKVNFKNLEEVKTKQNEIETALKDCKIAPPTDPQPEDPQPEDPVMTNSNVIIGGKEYDTTIANAGHHCEIAVPLVNLGETKVTNVVITPALSGDVTAWPFAIEKTDYSQVCDKLEGENSGKSILERKNTFRWTLKTRDDAVTGYTKLVFNVSYNEEDGTQKTVALDYYVQVNGVAPKAEGGKISTPRVIVTGFTTTPEEVYAGDTFKLTLNLKNTSKKTAVSNMLFDIQGTQEGKDADSTYSAFLPTAGSSTIYVDSIAPNASKSITIEMKSKSDLAQKPYVVTVNMEYEDSDANPFTETASVSVPIKQEPKVDVSSITVMPETMEVGNEANVMFSIYNVGKTKLYNVNVKFEADSISGGDTFIGNMDPGATGNVDAYLMGQAATMDDGTVKVLITYENEEGKEEKIEKTCTLFVSEPYYPEDMEGMGMPEEIEPEKTGLPWWGIVLIVVAAVIAAAAAVLVIKKKKRAKLQAQEELEVIDLLEDSQNEEK